MLSGPFLSDRSKPELRNFTPKSPGILSQTGVPLAIVTDHPVIPLQYLPLCAGLAVREGDEPGGSIAGNYLQSSENLPDRPPGRLP